MFLVLLGTAEAGRGRGRGHGHKKHHHGHGHKHHHAKHVRVSGGRYVFPGGVVRVYRKPVIRQRYYDVRVRPTVIVESYDPVPGYVWVAGNWTWGGAEWVWTPGYWAVAAEPAPVVQGGISVSAGISIR
jgi:hypothetical protein